MSEGKLDFDNTDWHYLTITAYTDSTHVTATVEGSAALVLAARTRCLSYFGGSMGWPSVATIYEQRLIMANTASYPATLFASSTGGFSDSVTMSPNRQVAIATDSDGFVYTIGDDQANAIQMAFLWTYFDDWDDWAEHSTQVEHHHLTPQ